MKYAQIINGTVHNVIVWNGETNLGLAGELIETGDTPVAIGYTYDGTNFIAPPVEEQSE